MAQQAQRAIDTILIDNTAMSHGSTHTANFDCAAADSATIRVLVSVLDGGSNGAGPTIALTNSDTTAAGSTIAANQSNVAGTNAAKELRYEVDMRARKRYLRIAITPDTNDTNDAFTATVLGSLTRNDADPVSTTAMGDDTVVIA